jgi:pimeloyl-ACP methyl ester carboxylesterase
MRPASATELIGGFSPFHRGGSGPPLLCLHGLTDTWRTWELVLPALERRHDVLALTLAGHAGGPPLPEPVDDGAVADAVERAMDAAGFEIAHVVGNSLGGYVALQLAARGRARTVVALAPAGGWAAGDDSYRETLDYFIEMRALLQMVASHADAIAGSADGRRRATLNIAERHEHIPAELISHMMRGAAACDAVVPLVDLARREGWRLDPERITCPVRIVWGTADRLLEWPRTTARYREWVPHADWIELDGVGHAPQLDVPLETAQLILDFTAR